MSASIAVHEELEPSEPPLPGAAAEPSQPELSQPGPSQLEPDPSPALSKKQLKKQQRRDHSQQSFAVKKKQKKEVRREAKRAERDTKQAAWEAMTEEEQEAVRKQVESERAARETKNAATAAAAAAAGPAPTCVIDLDFDELMDEQEVRSLVQQMMYSYGANKRASRPLDLHLTSLGGRIEEQVGCNRRYPGCSPVHPGCSPVHPGRAAPCVTCGAALPAQLHNIDGASKWAHHLTKHAGSYLEHFPPERLVCCSNPSPSPNPNPNHDPNPNPNP